MIVRCEQNVYALNTLQNKQIWELLKECHEKGGEKEMETEHLVSYLYQVKGFIEGSKNRNLMVRPIEEIIDALRRGVKDREDKIWCKKYQRAWKKLEAIIISGEVYKLLPPDLEKKGVSITAIVEGFRSIAQECFPPPENETIKLARSIGKQVKELLKELEAKMGD